MKKIVMFISLILFSFITFAQVSKTINVSTAGTLSTLLSESEKSTITSLTITGNIDARDFDCLKRNMALLTTLDIKQANIKAYTSDYSEIFLENQLPATAFYGCSNFKSIILPETLISIGDNAFRDCIGITSVSMPNTLISIGNSAFSNCILLTEMTIPNLVSSIGVNAFAYCYGLSTIQIPNSIKSIEDGTFKYCTSLSSMSIPGSVTTIGIGAFQGCENLSTLSIPNSVTTIGEDAFWNLKRLKSIYSYMQNPMALNSATFEKTNNAYCTLYVPNGTRSKYTQTSGWKYFLDIVEFDATTALKTSSSSDLEINYNSVSKSIILKGIDKPYSIAIFNFSGKTCYLNKYLDSNQSINADSLPQGIYVVKITVNNEVISRKIQVF